MTEREQTPDDLEPDRSIQARVAELLERYLQTSVIVGVNGMIVSGVIFISYVITGGLLTAVNSPWAPVDYLSPTADPGFYLTGSLVCVFVIQGTGSLMLYHYLTGVEDGQSGFVILTSGVGLGCGLAGARLLFPSALLFLSGLP